MTDLPNPGSDEALDLGCRCPVLDNHHGRGLVLGAKEVVWWQAKGCPLHGNPPCTCRGAWTGGGARLDVLCPRCDGG